MRLVRRSSGQESPAHAVRTTAQTKPRRGAGALRARLRSTRKWVAGRCKDWPDARRKVPAPDGHQARHRRRVPAAGRGPIRENSAARNCGCGAAVRDRLEPPAVAAEKHRLLYFCGFAGPFAPSALLRPFWRIRQAEATSRVHDPIAAGRRSASARDRGPGRRRRGGRAGVPPAGAGACAGGGDRGGLAMVAGNALAARMALDGITPAGIAFGRLLLGTLAKWTVAMAVFAIGIGSLALAAAADAGGAGGGLAGLPAGVESAVPNRQFRTSRSKSVGLKRERESTKTRLPKPDLAGPPNTSSTTCITCSGRSVTASS